MPELSGRSAIRHIKAGIAIAALGLIAVLIGGIRHDPNGFAAIYYDGVRGTGWMALLFGVVWAAFSYTHAHTHFFDLDRKCSAETFGIAAAAALGAVVLAAVLIVPRLPATPPDRMPPDPKMRETIVVQERNFRLFVTLALAACGAAVTTVPAIRFFRR